MVLLSPRHKLHQSSRPHWGDMPLMSHSAHFSLRKRINAQMRAWEHESEALFWWSSVQISRSCFSWRGIIRNQDKQENCQSSPPFPLSTRTLLRSCAKVDFLLTFLAHNKRISAFEVCRSLLCAHRENRGALCVTRCIPDALDVATPSICAHTHTDTALPLWSS